MVRAALCCVAYATDPLVLYTPSSPMPDPLGPILPHNTTGNAVAFREHCVGTAIALHAYLVEATRLETF